MQPPAERGEDGFLMLRTSSQQTERPLSQRRRRLRPPAEAIPPLSDSDVRLSPEATRKVRRNLQGSIDRLQPLDLPDPALNSAVQHPHPETPRIDLDRLAVPS